MVKFCVFPLEICSIKPTHIFMANKELTWYGVSYLQKFICNTFALIYRVNILICMWRGGGPWIVVKFSKVSPVPVCNMKYHSSNEDDE